MKTLRLFTRRELLEIALRPLPYPKEQKERVIDRLVDMPNYKFIRTIRKSTNLHVMTYAPGLYFIKYKQGEIDSQSEIPFKKRDFFI